MTARSSEDAKLHQRTGRRQRATTEGSRTGLPVWMLHPLAILAATYGGSWLLLRLNLVGVDTVTGETIALTLLGITALAIGAAYARPRKTSNKSPTHWTADVASFRVYRFVCLVAGFSVAIQSTAFVRSFGFGDLTLLQDNFQLHGWSFGVILGMLAIPTLSYRVVVGTPVSRADVLLLVGPISGLLLAGVKIYLLSSVLMGVFVYGTHSLRGVRVRYVAILVVATLAYWTFYVNAIDTRSVSRFETSRFPENLAALEQPYVYAVGPWPAFQKAVDGEATSERLGAGVGSAVWITLEQLGLAEDVPRQQSFVDIGPSVFNAYGLFGTLYLDFGIVGILVGGFLWGLASSLAFVVSLRRPTLPNCLLAGLLQTAVFLSFFAVTPRTPEIFLMAVIGLMALYLRKADRRARHNDERRVAGDMRVWTT